MIAAESIFNDGEGVVIFSLLPGVLASAITQTTDQVHALLLHEARGGLLPGQATFIRLKTALSLRWRTSALTNVSDSGATTACRYCGLVSIMTRSRRYYTKPLKFLL